MDRMKGLVLRDERRPDGQSLRELQTDLLTRIDRRKAAIATNPLMLENQRWREYIDGLAADQARAWMDYTQRLRESADATFDSAERTQ